MMFPHQSSHAWERERALGRKPFIDSADLDIHILFKLKRVFQRKKDQETLQASEFLSRLTNKKRGFRFTMRSIFYRSEFCDVLTLCEISF